MFNLNKFVMDTLKGMIGNEPDYKVTQYALGWFTREVLTETDLATIQSLIDEKNKPAEVISEEQYMGM